MRDTVRGVFDDSDIETGVLRGDLSMGDSRAVGLSDEGEGNRAFEGCALWQVDDADWLFQPLVIEPAYGVICGRRGEDLRRFVYLFRCFVDVVPLIGCCVLVKINKNFTSLPSYPIKLSMSR